MSSESEQVVGTGERPGPLWSVPVTSEPRRVSISEALGWFDGGADILIGNWWVLIASVLLVMVLHLWILVFPLTGALFTALSAPVFYAGMLSILHSSCDKKGPDTSLLRLLDGISHRCLSLLAQPVLRMVALVIGVILVAGLDELLGLNSLSSWGMRQSSWTTYFAGGVLVFVIAAINLSFFFYVPMTFLADKTIRGSLASSMRACRVNFLPLLAYQAMATLLMFLGALFVGVGMLYSIPMIVAANYAAFRQVFMQRGA